MLPSPQPLANSDIIALKNYAALELSKSNWIKRLFVSTALLDALERLDKENTTPQQIDEVYTAFFNSTGFLNWIGKKLLLGLATFASAPTTKAEEEKRTRTHDSIPAESTRDSANEPTHAPTDPMPTPPHQERTTPPENDQGTDSPVVNSNKTTAEANNTSPSRIPQRGGLLANGVMPVTAAPALNNSWQTNFFGLRPAKVEPGQGQGQVTQP